MLIVFDKKTGNIKLISMTLGTEPQTLENMLPNQDVSSYNSVNIPDDSCQISIESHRVLVNNAGDFAGFISLREERERESLEDKDFGKVNNFLLESPVKIIRKVLDNIQDKDRLILYQMAEVANKNRKELLDYFKERGL